MSGNTLIVRCPNGEDFYFKQLYIPAQEGFAYGIKAFRIRGYLVLHSSSRNIVRWLSNKEYFPVDLENILEFKEGIYFASNGFLITSIAE